MRKVSVNGRIYSSVGRFLFVADMGDNTFIATNDFVVRNGYPHLQTIDFSNCEFAVSRFAHPIHILVQDPPDKDKVYPHCEDEDMIHA